MSVDGSATKDIGHMAALAYALPAMSTQFVVAPVYTVLPGIYVTEFGVSTAVMGTALVAIRVWDAVTDPIVGFGSDWLQQHTGSRKQIIGLGAVTAMLGAYLLFVPPDSPTLGSIMIAGLILFLGWTMIEIPHTAWGNELAGSTSARTRIFLYRSLAGIIGGLGFAALPFAPWVESSEITSLTLRDAAIMFAVMAVGTLSLSLVVTKSGPRAAREGVRSPVVLSWAFVQSVTYNKPFWRLLLAFSMAGIGIGSFGALQFIYLKSYLGLGAETATVLGAGFLATLLALPVWMIVIRKIGKIYAWCVSFSLIAAGIGSIALIAPGPASFIPYMTASVTIALAAGAGIVVPFAILGDVIDYDRLRTGLSRYGLFTALFLMVVKLNGALGGGASFWALDAAGFDPARSDNDPSSIMWFKVIYCGLPVGLLLLATVIMWRFPITEARTRAVQARLAARDTSMRCAIDKN